MAVGEMKAKTGGVLFGVFVAVSTAGYFAFDSYNNSQVPDLRVEIANLKAEASEQQQTYEARLQDCATANQTLQQDFEMVSNALGEYDNLGADVSRLEEDLLILKGKVKNNNNRVGTARGYMDDVQGIQSNIDLDTATIGSPQ